MVDGRTSTEGERCDPRHVRARAARLQPLDLHRRRRCSAEPARSSRLVTERPGEELRERAEKLGWDCSELSNREIEERLLEMDRRKEQLQEAWRRRHTRPEPDEGRPGNRRK